MMNIKTLFFLTLSLFMLVPAALFAVPSGQVLTWEGGGKGAVKFKGDDHAKKGYTCESCHPSLFLRKKGSAKMTMALMNKGQFCGACHNGRVAFGTSNHGKCHECHKTHKAKKKHHDDDKKR